MLRKGRSCFAIGDSIFIGPHDAVIVKSGNDTIMDNTREKFCDRRNKPESAETNNK
ncbi:MAG: hypothetical protein K0S32_2788 [Bacteroidetes bacterium]|jgi:hypothetical protein|nr:hypothetical protein [Bacteroidota bacterium]